MSALNWQEWFDDSVNTNTARPYLTQGVHLVNVGRCIQVQFQSLALHSSNEGELELQVLTKLISRALKAANDPLVRRRNDDVDTIFNKAEEEIRKFSAKYSIRLDNDMDEAMKEDQKATTNLQAAKRTGEKVANLIKSKGFTELILTIWPPDMQNPRDRRKVLKLKIEYGLKLDHLLARIMQKSMERKHGLPPINLMQNPGFFTAIPVTLKDFSERNRGRFHGGRFHVGRHKHGSEVTLCQVDFQTPIDDRVETLHMLLDPPILPESVLSRFDPEKQDIIRRNYKNIWKLDERRGDYFAAREISGCLVYLDSRKPLPLSLPILPEPTSDGLPFITPAQMCAPNPDAGGRTPTQANSELWRLTEGAQTSGTRDYDMTWSNVISDDRRNDARPLFSVQSFEPQTKGSSSDIIVTVGMAPEDPTEVADTGMPSSPSQSTRRLSFHSAMSFIGGSSDNFRIPECQASSSHSFETSIGSMSGGFRTGNESNQVSPSSAVFSANCDRFSVISRDTFETAQEPPLELLLALGLHPPLPISVERPLANSPVPGFTDLSRNTGHEEESVDSENSITNSKVDCPQYNISFIRDVSKVCIIGSQINFTTNIIHNDDHVRVGLHTLYLRSDPTALHNSYERQKRVHQQVKAMRAWGSQLLITSSSTVGEYPLSVPSIKTRDLEEVVKDVFTWLYASSPYSIMWLCDKYEESTRTSLIAQCLANFLGERRDLTASYFYPKRGSPPQAELSHPGAGRKGDPSNIIPTIAYELARRIPEIEIPIALTAANDLWIFDLSLDEQMKKLIVDPLQAASRIVEGNSYKFPQLILIHGLEDCDDDDFQELFLRALGKSLALLQQSIPQKLMLLGKHTGHLQECFTKPELHQIVQHYYLPVSQDVAIQ